MTLSSNSTSEKVYKSLKSKSSKSNKISSSLIRKFTFKSKQEKGNNKSNKSSSSSSYKENNENQILRKLSKKGSQRESSKTGDRVAELDNLSNQEQRIQNQTTNILSNDSGTESIGKFLEQPQDPSSSIQRPESKISTNRQIEKTPNSRPQTPVSLNTCSSQRQVISTPTSSILKNSNKNLNDSSELNNTLNAKDNSISNIFLPDVESPWCPSGPGISPNLLELDPASSYKSTKTEENKTRHKETLVIRPASAADNIGLHTPTYRIKQGKPKLIHKSQYYQSPLISPRSTNNQYPAQLRLSGHGSSAVPCSPGTSIRPQSFDRSVRLSRSFGDLAEDPYYFCKSGPNLKHQFGDLSQNRGSTPSSLDHIGQRTTTVDLGLIYNRDIDEEIQNHYGTLRRKSSRKQSVRQYIRPHIEAENNNITAINNSLTVISSTCRRTLIDDTKNNTCNTITDRPNSSNLRYHSKESALNSSQSGISDVRHKIHANRPSAETYLTAGTDYHLPQKTEFEQNNISDYATSIGISGIRGSTKTIETGNTNLTLEQTSTRTSKITSVTRREDIDCDSQNLSKTSSQESHSPSNTNTRETIQKNSKDLQSLRNNTRLQAEKRLYLKQTRSLNNHSNHSYISRRSDPSIQTIYQTKGKLGAVYSIESPNTEPKTYHKEKTLESILRIPTQKSVEEELERQLQEYRKSLTLLGSKTNLHVVNANSTEEDNENELFTVNDSDYSELDAQDIELDDEHKRQRECYLEDPDLDSNNSHLDHRSQQPVNKIGRKTTEERSPLQTRKEISPRPDSNHRKAQRSNTLPELDYNNSNLDLRKQQHKLDYILEKTQSHDGDNQAAKNIVIQPTYISTKKKTITPTTTVDIISEVSLDDLTLGQDSQRESGLINNFNTNHYYPHAHRGGRSRSTSKEEASISLIINNRTVSALPEVIEQEENDDTEDEQPKYTITKLSPLSESPQISQSFAKDFPRTNTTTLNIDMTDNTCSESVLKSAIHIIAMQNASPLLSKKVIKTNNVPVSGMQINNLQASNVKERSNKIKNKNQDQTQSQNQNFSSLRTPSPDCLSKIKAQINAGGSYNNRASYDQAITSQVPLSPTNMANTLENDYSQMQLLAQHQQGSQNVKLFKSSTHSQLPAGSPPNNDNYYDETQPSQPLQNKTTDSFNSTAVISTNNISANLKEKIDKHKNLRKSRTKARTKRDLDGAMDHLKKRANYLNKSIAKASISMTQNLNTSGMVIDFPDPISTEHPNSYEHITISNSGKNSTKFKSSKSAGELISNDIENRRENGFKGYIKQVNGEVIITQTENSTNLSRENSVKYGDLRHINFKGEGWKRK